MKSELFDECMKDAISMLRKYMDPQVSACKKCGEDATTKEEMLKDEKPFKQELELAFILFKKRCKDV